MKRHDIRVLAMICLYQHLLLDKDIAESVIDNFDKTLNELDDFERILILHSIEHKERFIGYINEVLEDWSFHRLGYIEQAILLMACSEFDNKVATPSIIIDEAVELAKTYCDDEAYKLINGVLDRI